MTETKPPLLSWIENNRFYGLDYSTMFATCKDFTFDIRYDYDGKINVQPPLSCQLCLTIYFKHAKIESVSGLTVRTLTEYSEKYLWKFLKEYQIENL